MKSVLKGVTYKCLHKLKINKFNIYISITAQNNFASMFYDTYVFNFDFAGKNGPCYITVSTKKSV